MSDEIKSGPRKIPEEEKKFGLDLLGRLRLSPDEPIEALIIRADRSIDDGLIEKVSDILDDTDSSRLARAGSSILAVTINPPNIRAKLINIADNENVRKIELNKPVLPPTISVSYFR
jgi:hypothetical protein